MTEEGKRRLQGVKLGCIGAGAMGGAIIRGLLAREGVARENLIFYDPDPASQAKMEKLGVEAALDNAEVMHAQAVILAVKPQLLGPVLAGIKEFARPWHLIISIAAGYHPGDPGSGLARIPHHPGHAQCPGDCRHGHDLPGARKPRYPGRHRPGVGTLSCGGPDRGSGRKADGRGYGLKRQRPGVCGPAH